MRDTWPFKHRLTLQEMWATPRYVPPPSEGSYARSGRELVEGIAIDMLLDGPRFTPALQTTPTEPRRHGG
jgi:hypothetical protein